MDHGNLDDQDGYHASHVVHVRQIAIICHMHFMYAKYPGLILTTSMNVSYMFSQGASKAWRKNMSVEE